MCSGSSPCRDYASDFSWDLSPQILSWEVLPTALPPWADTMPPQPSWPHGGPQQGTVQDTLTFPQRNYPKPCKAQPLWVPVHQLPSLQSFYTTRRAKWALGTKCLSPRRVKGHQMSCREMQPLHYSGVSLGNTGLSKWISKDEELAIST